MDVEAGHNRDRGRAVDENVVLQTTMIVVSILTICFAVALFPNLRVELLPGLRVFAIYGSFNMAMVLLFLGMIQPWARFPMATVIMLVVLDLLLVLLAVGLTVKFPDAA